MRFFLHLVLILCSSVIFGQVMVSGVVKDNQEPLIGVSVVIVGTVDGTITDLEGNYQLEVPLGSTLAFSYIGYKSQEFIIDKAQVLDLNMIPDMDELEEVVVIGYGTVKKSDLTGSVSSIKSEDFIKTAVSTLDQGIQGKAAGVVVSMGTGQPGARSSTRIRGTTSILGDNEPLYVIDGVIIIPQTTGVGAVTGPTLNPLESINPADVASIEILKDASATAIYGARGANGVIIVTTKRGEAGKPEVNISFAQSFQELRHKIPMLNAAELATLGNEAADNADADRRPIYASPINLGVGTDWQEEIFEIAPMMDLQLSARGGKEGSTFAISGGYLDQNGILLNSRYQRGNIRINLDHNLNEVVTIGTSTNISRSKLQGTVTDSEGATPSSVTSWALAFNPGLPVIDENGEYTYENNTSQPSVGNPVADALFMQQETTATRILGNVYLKWQINDWLSFKTSPGSEVAFISERSFIPNDIFRGEASNGQAALGEIQNINILIENTLSFNRTFGNHAFNGVLGYSIQKYTSEFSYLATSDFDDNRLGFNAVQVGKLKTLVLNGNTQEQMQSFLGRVNYTLNDKYLFTASARVDGSSKFGAGNKYGLFPSFAVAWRAKDEPFLQNFSLFSDLTIRAGYGVVGNQGIPPYSSLGLLETTEAYFGENEIAKGSGQQTPQNDDLKWEQTQQYDIGADVSFLENRITLTLDAYYKKTNDLLVRVPLPYTSGFNESIVNVGSLENKGFELTLNTVNTTGKVEWRSAVTMGWNRNKILELNRDEGIVAENMLGITGWTSVEEGLPINTFFGFETAGIAQTSQDVGSIPHFVTNELQHGDRYYVDQNNDGIIDQEDIVNLGNAHPDFSFGFNNTVNYKAFSLSVFIQGVVGNEIVNFNRFGLESFDGLQNNSREALNRWTPENPSNVYPKATVEARPNVLSNHQVEDGSYLRIKDITLSYDLWKWLQAKQIDIRSFRVFMSAKNLVTITNYSGYDPEINRFIDSPLMFGADFGSYPTAKIFTTGVNITF